MSIPETSVSSVRLVEALSRLGVATSAQLQTALGCSQPTVSRALAALGGDVLVLGRGRRTRYALPAAWPGVQARLAVHWVAEDGLVTRWGTLSLTAGGQVHLEADDIDLMTRDALPWILAPLRAEGFLGRLLARRLADLGLDGQPERWPLAHQLLAALRQPDAPGALVLGEPLSITLPTLASPDDLDRLAADVDATQPIGSSAGGEQAKFLARRPDGTAVLVKFTPPRGTPFGERWHDLLHAEALALRTLGAHGLAVAQVDLMQTARRSALMATRFDRLHQPSAAVEGRRHVVPLHTVHEAFVGRPRQHWTATVEALVRQRRLPAEAAVQVDLLRRFGHLIGNTDMHFGNLSLIVDRLDAAAGRFRLAPVYDMLPMRWRPDPTTGALDLWAFMPESVDLQSAAAPLARRFWADVASCSAMSEGFRVLAGTMLSRLGPCSG